jgi:hypothetical protein
VPHDTSWREGADDVEPDVVDVADDVVPGLWLVDVADVVARGGVEPPQPVMTVTSDAATSAIRHAFRRPIGRTRC